jgi:cell wall-associated NlpC family hydrolase
MSDLFKSLSWQSRVLLEAIGTPYHWAKGDLTNAEWPPRQVDCSGFAQNALYAINIVNRDAWGDMTANSLAGICDAIYVPGKAGKVEDCQVGDLCFYGKPGKIWHVTVYLERGMCIGANGGGSKTEGEDDNACVQVRPINYSKQLVVVGRIKEKYRA